MQFLKWLSIFIPRASNEGHYIFDMTFSLLCKPIHHCHYNSVCIWTICHLHLHELMRWPSTASQRCHMQYDVATLALLYLKVVAI